MNQRIALFFVMLAFMGVWSAGGEGIQAQDTTPPHPLLEMLAFVPDTPEIRTEMREVLCWGVSYMDYRAIVAARPGVTPIASWEEYDALDNSEDQAAQDSADLWMAALGGAISGPRNFLAATFYHDEYAMAGVVGFDFFDVTRGLTYACEPRAVDVLVGEFDTTAIAQALSNRGYTSQEYAGGTLWCGPDGCESGMRTDLERANPANPFGGDLGREQPLLVLPGYLISAGDFDRIAAYPDLLAGSTPTLADAPDFQAAASAVLAAGTLMQAQFYHPAYFTYSDPPRALACDIRMTQPQCEAAVEALRADFVPLPRYSLVIFADIVTGDDQLTLIGLVYNDAAQAQTAAEVVYTRMLKYISMIGDQPLLTEQLAYWDGVIETPQLYNHAATGQTVVVIPWRAPMPPPEQPDEFPQLFVNSSVLFRNLIRSFYRQDLRWLAIGPEESE